MSYQNLTLRNVAGEVTAIYNDGSFRSLTPPDPRSGSTAAFIGTASTGVVHEFFEHSDRSLTFREFGADSEIAQMVQSAKVSDEALPVIVARIGAKNYSFAIDRPTATGYHEEDRLVEIVPLFVQEADADLSRVDTLSSIKMILLPFVDGAIARQRLLLGIVGNDGQTSVIYDSERKLISQGESIFNVKLDLPIGELLLTNAALRTPLVIADNANGFVVGSDNTTQLNFAERIELLRGLNELVDFDWSSAETLSSFALTDANVLYPYESNLADVVKGLNEITDANIKKITGAANKRISNLSKRYVGVDLAYKNLEYENVGFIYCEGCHADAESIDLDTLDLDEVSLEAQLTWPQRMLGNLWKFIHNGKEYSFMFGRRNPFAADKQVATYLQVIAGVNTTFSFSEEQRAIGDLLNLVEVHFHKLGDDEETKVESFANRKGLIEVHISVAQNANQPTVKTDFFNVTAAANAAFNEANFDGTILRIRPSMIDNDSSLSTTLRTIDSRDSNQDWSSDDPFVMTHYDLTGEFIPEAVMNRLLTFVDGLPDQTLEHSAKLVASNKEVREISFLHQAAQAAYTASTNYSQTLAVVPTSAPANSNDGLASWAGNTPTYEVDSAGVLKVTVDGSGVLGNKLLAGRKNYRNDAAFGGIILTEGSDLPNQIPYGIDDTDEAADAFGQKIDLGKHAIVVGAYGLVPDPANILRRGNNATRNPVYVNAGPKICAILNLLPPGSELIGTVNGVVNGLISRHRTRMAILNDLAFMRVCMIDENSIISSIYSSAHPTSDYRKISSTLSANAILGRLRSICMPYIGRPFKDEQIASLSQTIDGVMKQMVQEDYAQRIDVSLSASRLDRINGVLRASVRFIPPLSIEAITVEITLEPPAAGI
jgi:hypothetical protein